jgi:hypothetical protein
VIGSMRPWIQKPWNNETEVGLKIKIEDPESVALFMNSYFYLIALSLLSKNGLQEASESLYRIFDFYIDQDSSDLDFLPEVKLQDVSVEYEVDTSLVRNELVIGDD